MEFGVTFSGELSGSSCLRLSFPVRWVQVAEATALCLGFLSDGIRILGNPPRRGARNRKSHGLRLRYEAAFWGGASEGHPQKFTSASTNELANRIFSQYFLLLRKKHRSRALSCRGGPGRQISSRSGRGAPGDALHGARPVPQRLCGNGPGG